MLVIYQFFLQINNNSVTNMLKRQTNSCEQIHRSMHMERQGNINSHIHTVIDDLPFYLNIQDM